MPICELIMKNTYKYTAQKNTIAESGRVQNNRI